MVCRARFTVAYDGSPFHGFAEQTAPSGQPTVMGVLRAAVETVVRVPVVLVGAGRTDAGVHGWGQVVSLDLPQDTDLAALTHRLNRILAPHVVVREAGWAADPQFSARFSAEWRHYRYLVLNDPVGNPLLAASTWHVPQPLDLAVMRLACDPVIGEHDFSSFCRRPKVAPDVPEPSLTRRILRAEWRRVPHDQTERLLLFEIRGQSFCHQMVRSLVGTMVDIGVGRRYAGEMRSILLARSRDAAGQVAPPHGLCLWEVGYPLAPGGT
ncbi:MAG: tRNA pseudouridine(38-40) synthase TruA [Ilumatobacteraceae bacterium]